MSNDLSIHRFLFCTLNLILMHCLHKNILFKYSIIFYHISKSIQFLHSHLKSHTYSLITIFLLLVNEKFRLKRRFVPIQVVSIPPSLSNAYKDIYRSPIKNLRIEPKIQRLLILLIFLFLYLVYAYVLFKGLIQPTFSNIIFQLATFKKVMIK